MRKLVLSLIAITAIAGIAYSGITPSSPIIGNVTVKHANADGYTALLEGAPLLDDDEIRLGPNSSYDAVSAYGVPTLKIKHGDLGYWNAVLGTKNPPNPDWMRSRATFYTSYF